MKFNIVQIVKTAIVSHLIHDPIRLLLYTLEDLGHDVIVQKDNFAKDRINIIVIGTRLSEQEVDLLIRSKISYIVYQTEVFSAQGLNYQPNLLEKQCIEAQRVYLKLLQHALMIWECFDFNQRYLLELGIESHILHHGYHALLEGRPKKQEQDIDVAFFGTITPYREKILKNMKQKGFSLMILQHDGPLFRDEILRRSKINLSIRSNDNTMSHLPHFRVFTGLYHNTMTVSEQARGQDSMVGLVDLVEPSDIIQHLYTLLQTNSYLEMAQQHKQEFVRRPMVNYMQPLLIELSGRVS